MEVDPVAQEGEAVDVEGLEIEDDREMGDKSELPDESNTAGSEDTSMGENDVKWRQTRWYIRQVMHAKCPSDYRGYFRNH